MKQDRAYIDPLGNLHIGETTFSLRRQPDRWRQWLGEGHTFRIMGLHVDGYGVPMCSVRLKRIKGLAFWYAERKQRGRTRSIYLGKTDALTLDRLWSIASQLAHPSDKGL